MVARDFSRRCAAPACAAASLGDRDLERAVLQAAEKIAGARGDFFPGPVRWLSRGRVKKIEPAAAKSIGAMASTRPVVLP